MRNLPPGLPAGGACVLILFLGHPRISYQLLRTELAFLEPAMAESRVGQARFRLIIPPRYWLKNDDFSQSDSMHEVSDNHLKEKTCVGNQVFSGGPIGG